MKRILTSFALVAASLAFAQVGVNNDNPQATLDVKAKEATGTTTGTDGILIPRVDRARAQSMSTVEESTLIYVNSVSTGSQSGKAQNINTEGFYYYEGNNTSGKWVKLGGGTGVDKSIYAADGSIDGGNRVVTQNNNNVTYTTGTGEFIIDGTSRLNGRSHVNTTVVESGTSYTVLDNDYYISISSSAANGGGQFDVIVPAASESNKGRVLIISNRTGAANLKLKTSSGQQIINGSELEVIADNKAEWIISDGTKWFNLINL